MRGKLVDYLEIRQNRLEIRDKVTIICDSYNHYWQFFIFCHFTRETLCPIVCNSCSTVQVLYCFILSYTITYVGYAQLW